MPPTSSAPVQYRERERVLVQWERRRKGEHNTYAGRVLETYGELDGSGRRFLQTSVRVEYEGVLWRMWHKLSELSPLAEDAAVPLPPDASGSDDEGGDGGGGGDFSCVAATAWQELDLRCCYSLAPLTDPARCAGCTHVSRCNYDGLLLCQQSTRKRPQALQPSTSLALAPLFCRSPPYEPPRLHDARPALASLRF